MPRHHHTPAAELLREGIVIAWAAINETDLPTAERAVAACPPAAFARWETAVMRLWNFVLEKQRDA